MSTALRVMPALWLAIPIGILCGWYATLLYPADGYAVDATAKGTSTLPFVAGFCAACAAWEGSRLRRARLWDAPSVRSRLAIASWPLLPIVLIGLFAVGVAIGMELVRAEAGLPDLRLLAITALDLVAYSAFGFAVGLLLPFAVAGPLTIAASFFWLAFIPAMYPLWLRHLTGMFRDCCGLDQDLALRALLASAIVDLGIITAAALLVSGPALPIRRAGGALASLTLAALAGVILVAGMGYAPVVARDITMLECRTDDRVTVCTWPEHNTRAAEVARIVAEVRSGWQEAGMKVPSIFTEANASVAPAGALTFGFNGASSSEDNIISSLGSGMLPAWPDCPFGSAGGPAFDYLQAWYDSAGGMSRDGLDRAWASAWGEPDYPAVLAVVAELQAATPESRRAWVARAEVASQDCDEWRSDLIAVEP